MIWAAMASLSRIFFQALQYTQPAFYPYASQLLVNLNILHACSGPIWLFAGGMRKRPTDRGSEGACISGRPFGVNLRHPLTFVHVWTRATYIPHRQTGPARADQR